MKVLLNPKASDFQYCDAIFFRDYLGHEIVHWVAPVVSSEIRVDTTAGMEA